MAKQVKIFLCFLFLFSVAVSAQEECTVAVVSVKATVDGRPLLWKNRDTSFLDNEVAYYTDGKYPYIGVINAGDRSQVWMGVNSVGFAIMNSESQDLEGDTLDAEGYFMKQALMECATADDFEQLLIRTNETGRETKANFGVIDASGSAMFFEAGNHTFTKFDANDPDVAPLGFIVRANFAMTAVDTSKSYGQVRYRRANELFEKFVAEERLSYRVILRDISRDLVNEITDPYPLPFLEQENDKPVGFLRTHHSINRFRTASCAVFHGVLPYENPLLTTMWVILGEPVCGVAVPLWVSAENVPDVLVGEQKPVLNDLIQNIENQAYPDTSLKRYINTKFLVDEEGRGLFKNLFSIEDKNFEQTDRQLRKWRKKFASPRVVFDFETMIVNNTVQFLESYKATKCFPNKIQKKD